MEISLSKKTNKLVFGSGVQEVEPDIRTGERMREVLMEPGKLGAGECYYMHRGVCRERDCGAIERAGLRYDITVIPAIMHGREFNKTYGHFHERVKGAGTKITYPEVYEVLQGKAHYLMQNQTSGDVFFVEAKPGEKVVVPPNYGHVTINPSKTETLVMANWVERNFKSEYAEFRERRGAMYYETTGGFVENKNYKKGGKTKIAGLKIAGLRKLKPKNVAEFGLEKGRPMYESGVENLARLDFLKNPAKYLQVFGELLE